MLVSEISGKKKNSKTRVAEESHMSSQIVQCQPSKCTEKLPRSGPRLGADAGSTNTPEGYTVCTLLRNVHIGDSRATRRQERRAEESGRETEGHEHTNIGNK